MAELAEEAGRTTDAIDWYARVRRGEQFLPALTRRAVLLGKLGRVDEARELLRSTSVGSVRERVHGGRGARVGLPTPARSRAPDCGCG